MIIENHPSVRRRIQLPLALLPLLALLLAVVSSVTSPQASAARADHGFVGTLDHLLVASHTESLRAQSGNYGNDAVADGAPDVPDGWRDDSIAVWAGLYGRTCIVSACAGHPRSAARFLTPLLRAPPLA